MRSSRAPVMAGFLCALLAVAGCSSSGATGSAGGPVIETVQIPSAGKKAADGKYDLTVQVTAHAGGFIASARIDFSSAEPPRLVGTEVTVGQQNLTALPLSFRLDGSAGPGTADANLVLTDDEGNQSKKKIIVLLTP